MVKPGRVAQSVTCLATDAYLTADPGVASSIPVRSHTFVEIDHEIISMVIPANDTRESMFGHRNFSRRERESNLGPLAPEASAKPLSYHAFMTIAVNLGRKATKQTNKQNMVKF